MVKPKVDRPRIFKERPSASACNDIEKKPPSVPLRRPYYSFFLASVRARHS